MSERTLQERLRTFVVPGRRVLVPNGIMLEAADALDERDARIAALDARLAEAVDLLRAASRAQPQWWWEQVYAFIAAYDKEAPDE